MSVTRGVRPELLPAGKHMIASMVTKGWIKKQPDGRTFCITSAGVEALKAPIP